jgi:hypothetical protein
MGGADAKGSSRVVYVPASSRKPWMPLAFSYHPTIWPALLMPKAVVPAVAEGSSRVV